MDLWLKDLKSNSNPDIKIFLIGNKSDLEDERVVSREEAEQFKNDYDLDLFMETSAKNGINSTELFTEAAKLLFNDYSKYIGLSYNIILPLNGNENGGYEYAWSTPISKVIVSKNNIYNKSEESLRNYININSNRFEAEIIDPNTGLIY